ncbi:hypothetical protein [Methylobacterium aquaticum]|uniref:YD repeat-containing protein n=1 Tax=Methylobacterium aquaticum TaxID=270351 RepID=A0A0C6FRU6_9HYPH|nr:hypothetical protein [Methylobacterium aquaticum]BAQ45490.1 hypothetical protein Maq22A_c11125 [Methylobacterium aquaticum]
MFDEIVANPEPGPLDFHRADGKVVRFDRPFNFLASHNAGVPHLDLRAPWLRQLELRDCRPIKHFRQDEDDIYRLARIEDLDGHAITFLRDADRVLERAEGTDGLALAFTNDERGRRTGITLIGTDGSRLDLARYAYDAKGRMTEADCAFGMSVAYLWEPDRDLLAAWHNRTRRSQSRFTYDAATRRTTSLPGAAEALAQRFRLRRAPQRHRRDRRLRPQSLPHLRRSRLRDRASARTRSPTWRGSRWPPPGSSKRLS